MRGVISEIKSWSHGGSAAVTTCYLAVVAFLAFVGALVTILLAVNGYWAHAIFTLICVAVMWAVGWWIYNGQRELEKIKRNRW